MGRSVNLMSFRTTQRTYSVLVTKSKRLMLFREIIDFVCEKGTEHINRPKVSKQNTDFRTTHIVTIGIKWLIGVLYVYFLWMFLHLQRIRTLLFLVFLSFFLFISFIACISFLSFLVLLILTTEVFIKVVESVWKNTLMGTKLRTFGTEIVLPTTCHTVLQLGIVCAMRCTGFMEEHYRIVSCLEWLATGNKASATLGCIGVIFSLLMTDDRRTRIPTPRSLCKRPAPMRGSLSRTPDDLLHLKVEGVFAGGDGIAWDRQLVFHSSQL